MSPGYKTQPLGMRLRFRFDFSDQNMAVGIIVVDNERFASYFGEVLDSCMTPNPLVAHDAILTSS